MGTVTTLVVLDDENSFDCEVEYSYKAGSSDYFSDGAWYPGDPPEINIESITKIGGGEKIDFNQLSGYAQERIWAAIEWHEASCGSETEPERGDDDYY